MTGKTNKNRKRNEMGIMPFPPSPMQPMRLPHVPSKNWIPILAGLIGGIGLIALLVFYAPWQFVPWASMYTQIKQIGQIKLPKITLPQKTQTAPEVLPEESPIVEPLTPPPIPEPDPNMLFARYPVRKYTDISHTISREDTIFGLVRRYRGQIFPKKYVNFKALAQYNNIRPPNYILIPGKKLRIPTAEHIVSPKVGYETELRQTQSEHANQPNNPELLNRLALIYFKRSELYKARTELRKGIKRSPNNGALHNNLGFIYLILEDDKRAKVHLGRAITLLEQSAIPLCNRGLLFLTQEKIDLAISDFEAALEGNPDRLDPHLLDAKYNLALAHQRIGEIEPANQYLNELVRILPDDVEVVAALEAGQ